ncbi:MAG: MFS transporter, partial [Paracoccaceae bacterium]
MRWRMLILMASARLALGLQFQTLASTSEYLILDFALNYTQIGTLIGLFMLPGLVLAIPAGMLGRYASDRMLVAFGLGLLSLGGFIAALADGYNQIAVGRLFCGAGFVFSTIYFTKMVADWFSGREIATALSILVMTWPLGIAIGQVGHEWLSANLGWHTAFVTASAYGVIAMTAVAVFYRAPMAKADDAALPAWSL